MINRDISPHLKRLAKKFPVVSLTGPRQSGKTTLLKNLFPKLPYVTLEDPDNKLHADQDPRDFLKQFPKGAFFDEVQRVPHLFSYLQAIVDEANKPGMFLLSGSQNFLLLEKISQTLAGRIGILRLLPLSFAELQSGKFKFKDYEELIFKGCYPRIYQRNISPADFYPGYIQTYVERDFKQVKNIPEQSIFIRFLKLCAGRTGQLLNFTSLANDCGISPNTAKAWLSVLQASYIIFLLQPYHKNFNKRVVKTPKLYFYDTGLACSLLGIEKQQQVSSHFLLGGLFENWVLTEIIKTQLNNGKRENCFFWRNNDGTEVDFIIEKANELLPVEVKAGATMNESYFRQTDQWLKWAGKQSKKAYIIYGGKAPRTKNKTFLVPWRAIDTVMGKI